MDTHIHDFDVVLNGHALHMVCTQGLLQAMPGVYDSQQRRCCCDELWHGLCLHSQRLRSLRSSCISVLCHTMIKGKKVISSCCSPLIHPSAGTPLGNKEMEEKRNQEKKQQPLVVNAIMCMMLALKGCLQQGPDCRQEVLDIPAS